MEKQGGMAFGFAEEGDSCYKTGWIELTYSIKMYYSISTTAWFFPWPTLCGSLRNSSFENVAVAITEGQ
jgi:hypothetical protein